MELDAVDQSKFAWPRSMHMQSKDLAGVARPRLHVTGALVHGYFKYVYVSEADRKKDSNYTIHILANIITRLRNFGVNMSETHLRINLDNTCRENKSQKVFRYLAWLVSTGLVKRS